MADQQGGKPPGPPGWGPPAPSPYAPPQAPAQYPQPQQAPYPYPQPQPPPYPQQQGQAPYPQQQQQPYPQQQAPYPPQPQPYPYPPQPGSALPSPSPAYPGPYPQPPAGAPYPYPPGAAPFPPPHQPPPPPPAEGAMLQRTLGRAFRLRIEPNEVTPNEHAALVHASTPISDPHLMAFLAWRRAVLLLVAVALVPLTLLRFYDAFKDTVPDQLRFLFIFPAAAEAALCVVCWYQLKNWTSWRRQRRTLFRAWLIFMGAPFVVFLIPVHAIADELAQSSGDPTAKLLPTVVAVMALLTLAPKAVSLLAGTIRAAIVTKMLFPGVAGPGWLMVLATPIYTLFAFTLLVVPYHITGSGWFFGAMIALAGGQLILARAGYSLARPTTHDDAVQTVRRARAIYLFAMLAFGGCLVAALGTLVEQLGASTIASTVLSYETNVLILTLIGSDLLITNLERARGLTTGTAHLAEESNRRLSAFVGET
jgi:hypothetical protein